MNALTTRSLVLLLFAVPLVHAQGRRITIGTQSAGTVYYTVGGGLGKLLQEKLRRPATVQPAAGASVYLPLIESGEVTMGISSSVDSGGAFRGDRGRKPIRTLRVIARLWPLGYAYVASARSGLKSMSDLRGKRVVVDIQANAALGTANAAMLAAAGLQTADVRAVTVGDLAQGIRGVTEGTVDAAPFAVGGPAVKEAHASVPGGIVYLALDGSNATSAFLGSRQRGQYVLTVRPNEALTELTRETKVLGMDIFLVASERLPDVEVTAILRTLHENWTLLQRDYPALRTGAAGELAAASNAIPYHRAAVAYFKSHSLWTAENDRNDAALLK